MIVLQHCIVYVVVKDANKKDGEADKEKKL